MADQLHDSVMRAMRHEYMPREALNITFAHIEKNLLGMREHAEKRFSEIEVNLKSLPRELANEFESRFGDRIEKLEAKVEKLEAFYLKCMGGMAALVALAKALEHYLKL